MKKELINTLTATFEEHVSYTEQGIEFWFARDLQHLLGYSEWRNFTKVISKAKTSCEASGNDILDHFVEVNKMVTIGSGAQKEIDDLDVKEHRTQKPLSQSPTEKKFISTFHNCSLAFSTLSESTIIVAINAQFLRKVMG